jgi:hypothetical protein
MENMSLISPDLDYNFFVALTIFMIISMHIQEHYHFYLAYNVRKVFAFHDRVLDFLATVVLRDTLSMSNTM